MMAESQAAQMAQQTEAMIAHMEKMTSNITTMIEQMEEKGYAREFAINYVNQFMQQQTAMAETQAAQARASEAEMAFLRDRMANATTGLNRAENQLQMHQMMDAAMPDPTMQGQQQATVQQIAQKAMMMNDDDRKRFLDHLEATQRVVHQQVVAMLGE